MRIPTKEECFRLICEMEMMDHIVAHSLQVCRVAVFLTDRLAARNIGLNRDMVQASALLHDITKTRSFETRENHAQTGDELLRDLGYPEVGWVVGQHVRLDAYFSPGGPTEAEIVNYADKRVLHDQVVSLEARMAYILEKYGGEADQRERIRWLRGKTEELEERLFGYLPIKASDLPGYFTAEGFALELDAYRKCCANAPTDSSGKSAGRWKAR